MNNDPKEEQIMLSILLAFKSNGEKHTQCIVFLEQSKLDVHQSTVFGLFENSHVKLKIKQQNAQSFARFLTQNKLYPPPPPVASLYIKHLYSLSK